MKRAIAALFATSVLGLAACEDQGPFEEAGENIDDAIEDAEDTVTNN